MEHSEIIKSCEEASEKTNRIFLADKTKLNPSLWN